MSVIIGIVSLVFGSYIAQPEWFDNGPFEFVEHYESVEECQIATHGTGDICVGEQPSNRYILAGKYKDTPMTSAELTFVECDYWAGCYLGDK